MRTLAKGRVERSYGWLQDRLVRTCVREDVTDIRAAQRVLNREIHRYNYTGPLNHPRGPLLPFSTGTGGEEISVQRVYGETTVSIGEGYLLPAHRENH